MSPVLELECDRVKDYDILKWYTQNIISHRTKEYILTLTRKLKQR